MIDNAAYEWGKFTPSRCAGESSLPGDSEVHRNHQGKTNGGGVPLDST